jgi:hypothetical protein
MSNRAVAVDPEAPDRLVIRSVADPVTLADLVEAGQLAPHISLERAWTEIGQIAEDLMARPFPGKAVLTLE